MSDQNAILLAIAIAVLGLGIRAMRRPRKGPDGYIERKSRWWAGGDFGSDGGDGGGD
jgi:hypothetical protein